MPNPYTGTENDPFQQAQHRYAGPDWERFFGSLQGKRVNMAGFGQPGRGVSLGAMQGSGSPTAETDALDTARTYAASNYVDDYRAQQQDQRMRTAQADLAEQAVKAGQRAALDRDVIDRAAVASGPASPIVSHGAGMYTAEPDPTAPPMSPIEQRAAFLSKVPGSIRPIYEKQFAAQDAVSQKAQLERDKLTETTRNNDLKAAAAEGKAAGGLEPDAVDYTATQYRILGPSGIPTRIEGPDRVKILNEASKQAKALGQSPAQAVQKQAAFKADAGSLNKMSTMKSSAEAFETKAVAQADLVKELSDKLDRSSIPLINDAIIKGKKELAGDETAQLYTNALTTFAAEYAKIMEGSTGSVAGSSESGRKAATDLIRVGLTKGQIKSTIDQMQWEMKQTIKGYDATIDHITTRMGGAPSSGGPAAPAGIVEMVAPDGRRLHVPSADVERMTGLGAKPAGGG
jgi:hypothetical protein